MANTNIFITYEELSKLQKDSADKASIIAIINTEFPDETCQLIAIKSILGIKPAEETETPGDNVNTDPTEPAEGDDTPGTDPAEGSEDTPATEPTEPAEGEAP